MSTQENHRSKWRHCQAGLTLGVFFHAVFLIWAVANWPDAFKEMGEYYGWKIDSRPLYQYVFSHPKTRYDIEAATIGEMGFIFIPVFAIFSWILSCVKPLQILQRVDRYGILGAFTGLAILLWLHGFCFLIFREDYG